MLKEQFDVAVAGTRIRKPQLIEAACAVIVNGEGAPEVAMRLGLPDTSQIYKTVASIQRKWAEICAQNNWIYLPLALPERMMRIILEIQAQELADYQAGQGKRAKKKA